MSSIWDDPAVKPSGDFVKFETVGDAVTGTVLDVSIHTFEDGKRAAKLVIRTAEGDRTLTAGQLQLAAKLAEARPNVGDTLAINFVGIEKRAGGKTLKQFTVAVTRGNSSGDDLI
jgi:hypothetical protein